MNTDKFQGECLEAYEGWQFMISYDHLPPDVRLRLQSSDLNLCPACVCKHAPFNGNYPDYHASIDQMVAILRAKETQCLEK